MLGRKWNGKCPSSHLEAAPATGAFTGAFLAAFLVSVNAPVAIAESNLQLGHLQETSATSEQWLIAREAR